MTTLKEDLNYLSDSLPQVQEAASQATAQAHALAEAAAALLQELQQARDEMSSHLTHVHDAWPAVKVQIETLEKELETAGGTVQLQWDKAHTELDEAGHALQAAGEHFHPKPGAVQNAFSQAGGRLEQGIADGAPTFERLGSTAHEGGVKLHAAAAAVVAETAGLRELLEHLHGEIHDAERALFEKLIAIAKAREQDATGLTEKLTQHYKELDSAVMTTFGDLGHVITDLESNWESHLRDTVTTPLTAAAEVVHAALGELSQDADQHENVVRQHATVEESALVELEQTANRLPDGIRQIKEAVEKLRAQ